MGVARADHHPKEKSSMNLTDVGRLLVGAGVVLVAVGGLVILAARSGWNGLPGDLSFRADGVRVYVPMVTCLLLSLVATVVLNLFLRR